MSADNVLNISAHVFLPDAGTASERLDACDRMKRRTSLN